MNERSVALPVPRDAKREPARIAGAMAPPVVALARGVLEWIRHGRAQDVVLGLRTAVRVGVACAGGVDNKRHAQHHYIVRT